jgi:hypothetical protein
MNSSSSILELAISTSVILHHAAVWLYGFEGGDGSTAPEMIL